MPDNHDEKNKFDKILELQAKIDKILSRDSAVEDAKIKIEPKEIDAVPFGKTVTTPFGPCYIMEFKYDLGDFHGHRRIREVFQVDGKPISEILKEPTTKALDPKNALYLDIESTGLSAAEGAFAFMIGLGFFEKDCFKVVQLFARDYTEEPAALDFLVKIAGNHTHLVTFNGRSFDIPMLDSRLALAKFDARLGLMPHIDLLVPARRLWKYNDHRCSLGALEKAQLGFVRHGDVPGVEIPALYNEYLRTRDLRKLVVVFTHNIYDVVSMVVLQTHISEILSDQRDVELAPTEVYALGRIHNFYGRTDRAYLLFEKCVKNLKGEQQLGAYKEMAKILRKEKRLDDAAKIYEAMLLQKPEKLFPYMKLAVHLENRAKDFKGALKVIEYGFENVVFTTYEKKENWENRKQRVLTKLEKSKTEAK